MPVSSTKPPVEAGEKLQIGEAAKRIGIHRNTLRRYAKAGYIKFGMFTVPSTVDGREDRSYIFFLGEWILEFWEKRRRKFR